MFVTRSVANAIVGGAVEGAHGRFVKNAVTLVVTTLVKKGNEFAITRSGYRAKSAPGPLVNAASTNGVRFELKINWAVLLFVTKVNVSGPATSRFKLLVRSRYLNPPTSSRVRPVKKLPKVGMSEEMAVNVLANGSTG